MAARAGAYAVVLALDSACTLRIGRLGRVRLMPGLYAYVGSARGPGGVRARLRRHFGQGGKASHWHIDYLVGRAPAVGAVIRYGRVRLECRWARRLARSGLVHRVVTGFGASDCRCPGHLLFAPSPSAPQALLARLQAHLDPGSCLTIHPVGAAPPR